MRSMATRRQHLATSCGAQGRDRASYKGAGFDLVIVETAGIGQSDSEIVDLVDLPIYVMTSEYGAASQLEKIDMLDLADFVVLNKFDKRGAEDALRDVRKQWRRNRSRSELRRRRGAGVPDDRQPVQRPGRDLDVRERCAGAGASKRQRRRPERLAPGIDPGHYQEPRAQHR